MVDLDSNLSKLEQRNGKFQEGEGHVGMKKLLKKDNMVSNLE
jgi:hypothetical protein